MLVPDLEKMVRLIVQQQQSQNNQLILLIQGSQNIFLYFVNSQVEAAQLAANKASTQNVKVFAKQNAQLYSGLSNYLNQISENYTVKLPAELSATAKENLQNLEAIKGPSFDHAYLLQMLKDHNTMIREYNAAKNIQCVPLKTFVLSNQSTIIKQAYALSDLKDKTP